MTLSHEQLNELREYFRREFDKHDFCIGQGQVERVFRELLGEPEPVYERPISYGHEPAIKTEQINEVIRDMYGKRFNSMFENDDPFLSKLKR